MEIPAAKQRAILAALLVNVNATVSADRLTEVLWAAAPPPSAAIAVRNYVMRLRRQLGAAGARIVTRPEGYAVEVDDPRDFDLTQVDWLHREARTQARAGRWSRASELLGAALALWRGEPLTDVPAAELFQQEAARLGELRLQLTEAWIDADLRLARHGEVVPELQRLAAEHPLREHMRAQLMIALYHTGRQAEALEMYRNTRAMLIAELGVEPGPELRELHRHVLAGEAALVGLPSGTAAPGPGPGPGAGGPQRATWHLPAAVPGFAGRHDQLAALSQLLGQSAAGAAVVVVSGPPGVGKTGLAVRWAQQAAGFFPDGQLYVDLGGYGAGQPVSAADALAGLLRALGVAGPDIPDATADRAAAYRSLLAGRRILVVLDNASGSAQVRPLLPGRAAGAVLVTSRDALAGLVARDGAVRLELDPLPLGDAVELLRTLIGARVTDEPAAAAALAGYCSGLPLALRVAAELAVAYPAVSLAKLAGQLADLRDRLDQLDAGGDEQTAVRSVLSWSCRRLDPGAARAFGLLGQHPGADFDEYAAAALTGTTPGEAGRLLDQLARASLIHPAGPGRYGLHDLLRAYAREHPGAGQGAGEEAAGRRAALSRLFDYYLHTASAAADTLFAARRRRVPRGSSAFPGAPPVDSAPSARAWLETELGNLLAAVVVMTEEGWPGQAARLAAAIGPYLESAGRAPEAVTVHRRVMRAARLADDGAGEAAALGNLAVIDRRLGRYPQAAEHHQQAAALFRHGWARAHHGLARAYQAVGSPDQARGHFGAALNLYSQLGAPQAEQIRVQLAALDSNPAVP